jgi:prolipoprotein diacylglyceryltransferase
VLRYSTEQFREPDSRVIALGLTLPMILSITMVAVSVVFLALSRKAQPIGGLVRTVARG